MNIKNLLITTLGTSWQIVPELIGLTNPKTFDFFKNSDIATNLRQTNSIKPVDECWIITTEGQKDLEKLQNWAEKWKITLRVFICKDVNSFQTIEEIEKMRSLIYRIVFMGSETAQNLYLSLSGGRKTMSADMQEAGNLFGCDAMFHVIDCKQPPENMKTDSFLSLPDNSITDCFIPILINGKIKRSLVVSADEKPLSINDWKIKLITPDSFFIKQEIDDSDKFANEIKNRKQRSEQLFSNFYTSISKEQISKRDIFKKLYFLHPDILRQLTNYKIGINPKRDIQILRKLPKVELHSHLGGVLSPKKIIKVAKSVSSNELNDDFFSKNVKKILEYQDDIESFEKEIYANLDMSTCKGIGIDTYQKLGNFQGSSLLQTEETIRKTISCYAKSLIKENIKYVEIRCSPYKYTKRGLTDKQVLNIIISELDNYSYNFDYRLIYIIGRQDSNSKIRKVINSILNLLEEESIKKRLVGIDLAGNESYSKPSKIRTSFIPILEKCVHITIHAGETESVESIWGAVYQLSADRIGHGLTLVDNPSLLEKFRERKIGIEMCPSSNDQIVGFTNEKEYPLLQYLEKGLKVTINTDDQGISRTNLTKEFIKAGQLCKNLSLWDCIVLIRNSIRLAFCDMTTKTKLMKSFEDEILTIINEEFGQ